MRISPISTINRTTQVCKPTSTCFNQVSMPKINNNNQLGFKRGNELFKVSNSGLAGIVSYAAAMQYIANDIIATLCGVAGFMGFYYLQSKFLDSNNGGGKGATA